MENVKDAPVGGNAEAAPAGVELKKEKDDKHPHQFEVVVIYNGVKKSFEVSRDELVKQLLDRAIQAFGPINNPHLLGLFAKDVELKDTQTIKEAGLRPHEELLLRPSAVRGG